ncbi:hypothetical protein AB0H20_01865 [Nocardia fluminea]|uniref:hypothetical protein n=1 Tax=Nocardia fluminea TaxID=134984 RepID=UPI0033DCFCF0
MGEEPHSADEEQVDDVSEVPARTPSRTGRRSEEARLQMRIAAIAAVSALLGAAVGATASIVTTQAQLAASAQTSRDDFKRERLTEAYQELLRHARSMDAWLVQIAIRMIPGYPSNLFDEIPEDYRPSEQPKQNDELGLRTLGEEMTALTAAIGEMELIAPADLIAIAREMRQQFGQAGKIYFLALMDVGHDVAARQQFLQRAENARKDAVESINKFAAQARADLGVN